MQVNYYEVLGCRKKSSHEEIKRAYRKRLLQLHPDKSDASKKDSGEFHEIQKAWSVLGNPQSRRQYDATCKQEELEYESELVYDRIKAEELVANVFENSFYRCRCGGYYFVEPEDLEMNTILEVTCDSCTLVLLIET